MPPLRVGLVSSVGGHLAELAELAPALEGCDLFLVLNDEAPWRRGFPSARPYRIVHAERDLRLVVSFAQAARILLRERPSVLISAGASPAVPFFSLGRLFGAKTVFIETFAAVEQPTLSGRLCYPLADHFFVQWPELLRTFPRARYSGPVFAAAPPQDAEVKRRSQAPSPSVFVTVGSSPRPCRRLLGFVDALLEKGALPGSLLVQSVATGYTPRRFSLTPFLDADALDKTLASAGRIVCHGGAGILGACLAHGRHPIVVPRRAAFGEAVNDHQLMLCRALSARGLVTVCETESALAAALAAPEPAPVAAAMQGGLRPALAELLRELAAGR
jgi:UDP-N-acetylglucosamine transferase subunit ALG13